MMSDSLQVGQLPCVIFSQHVTLLTPPRTTGHGGAASVILRCWCLFCIGCRLARSRIWGLGVVQVVSDCRGRSSPFSPGSRVSHFAELFKNRFFFACRSLRFAGPAVISGRIRTKNFLTPFNILFVAFRRRARSCLLAGCSDRRSDRRR